MSDGCMSDDAARGRQSEEAAVLAVTLARLGLESGYFVDVGAWDGLRLSNTASLADQGWRGLMIEADGHRFAQLERNNRWPQVTALHRRVGVTGASTLDAILDDAGAPEIVELLDVDIDSDDLAVWMSMTRHRATCVLIEYNTTIPFDTDFINPLGRNWGNSARSIVQIARMKGYALTAVTAMNLLLVDRAAASAADIAELDLSTVPPRAGRRYFWGYDGTLLVGGHGGTTAPEVLTVPLHDYRFAQPLPPRLRRWSVDGRHRPAERRASAVEALRHPVRRWRHWRRRTHPS